LPVWKYLSTLGVFYNLWLTHSNPLSSVIVFSFRKTTFIPFFWVKNNLFGSKMIIFATSQLPVDVFSMLATQTICRSRRRVRQVVPPHDVERRVLCANSFL
jgi:hypothetical protein